MVSDNEYPEDQSVGTPFEKHVRTWGALPVRFSADWLSSDPRYILVIY